MPSKSKSQARLMAAAAHNPAFAKKVGIPEKVAKEFNQADKGKKFAEGGIADTAGMRKFKNYKNLFKDRVEYNDEPFRAKGTKMKSKMGNLFKGKETKTEESKEKKAVGSGAAYKKAEKKFEGEKFAKGGAVGKGAAETPSGKTMGGMGMKCGGKVKKMAEGGNVPAPTPAPKKEAVPDFAKDKNQDVKNQKAAEQYQKTRKFAKGGGIEVKGKTKGRFV
jgi:hypothetical protein